MPTEVWIVRLDEIDYEDTQTTVLGVFSSVASAKEFKGSYTYDTSRPGSWPAHQVNVEGPYTLDAWSRI